MEQRNNRKRRRTNFNREVILRSSDGKTSTIKACNISTSGIGLFAENPRTQGELLHLKFDLIQNGVKRVVDVPGEIKHVQLVEHGYNFGVRFL